MVYDGVKTHWPLCEVPLAYLRRASWKDLEKWIKEAVGSYWAKSLDLFPDLRFELIALMIGVNSLTLIYKGARGQMAAEVFHFGPDHKVSKAYAHYSVE